MKEAILKILNESLSVKEKSVKENIARIAQAADLLIGAIRAGNKILIFGNGGSAADAQHIAAEFVNRFQIERPPLAALALTTDTSILTSIGNDYHFDDIFSKQIQAIGKKNDIAIAISTSGNSSNVIKAVQSAQALKISSIGLTGRGGELARWADVVLTVDSDVTARIQETHITMGHILCGLVDSILYGDKNEAH